MGRLSCNHSYSIRPKGTMYFQGVLSFAGVAAVVLAISEECYGFHHSNNLRIVITPSSIRQKNNAKLQPKRTMRETTMPGSSSSSSLFMSSQYDISKPVFDFLSLRVVRGDAVIRYDSLNQSEPLRIILYGLFGLTFLSAPMLVEAIGYEAMNTPTTLVSILFAFASCGLFIRECKRRSNQLTRIEKELNTEILPIRLPVTNLFSEMAFSKPATLKDLKSLSRPPRIIALYGNESKLRDALSSLAVYGQRLSQASVFVVAVSSSPSSSLSSSSATSTESWQVLDRSCYKPWLADAYDPQIWRDYFRGLADNDQNDPIQFRWFGLNSSGRSFGSGDDNVPQWLQILGQHLRPCDFFDVELPTATTQGRGSGIDSIVATKAELVECVNNFYTALTTGVMGGIEEVFSKSSSSEVTEVSLPQLAK
jgi:hypothetical protein